MTELMTGCVLVICNLKTGRLIVCEWIGGGIDGLMMVVKKKSRRTTR